MQSQATFVSRDSCISCGSSSLSRLDGGAFGEAPVRPFIEEGAWGVSPMPYIKDSEWELVSCDGCSQMFHRYILAPDWQEKRFSEWMGREAIDRFSENRGMYTLDYRFRANQERMQHILKIEMLTRRIRGQETVRLLDFGCGDGEVVALAKLSGFDAYGLDRDAHRRGANPDLYPSLELLDEAARDKFHAVMLIEVLEHLDDPMVVLQLVHERMVDDGVLVIEVPNCQGVTGISNEKEYDLVHPLDHINCFVPNSLKGIARRAGFRVIRPPSAYVTAEPKRAIKTFLRDQITWFLRPMTRFCFRKIRTS